MSGDVFDKGDNCNTCKCLADGTVQCSGKSCFSNCRHNGVVYKAGQSFKPDKCNTCWCMVTGDLSCTDMSCYPDCKHQGKTYKAGETFLKGDNCNTCTCTVTGDVTCGKESCLPVQTTTQSYIPLPPQPTPNYIDVTVRCQHNGYTYNVGDTTPSQDGCNECTCRQNGNMECTNNVCSNDDRK